MTRFILYLTLVIAAIGARPAAAQQVTVGLLPFDVVSVEGAGTQAGESLAKLIRVEMIRAKKVRPVLLELPAESKLPIDALDAAKIGKAGGAALVVSGTVIEAVESHSSNSANTGGLMGNLGVGGSLSRSTARVSLNIELVDAETGETVKNFEVSAKNTDVGLGADFSTTLGSMDLGGGAGDKTPMAKALREAARKVNEEVAKVAVKRR